MPWVSGSKFDELVNRVEALEATSDDALLTLRSLNRYLIQIVKQLKRLAGAEHAGPIRLTQRKENSGMFTFDILLPQNQDADTVRGELTYTIGGADPQVVETTLGQEAVMSLAGAEGDRVTASFVWIDNAGNRSVNPSTLDQTLTDTIPPVDPGQIGLRVTSET